MRGRAAKELKENKKHVYRGERLLDRNQLINKWKQLGEQWEDEAI